MLFHGKSLPVVTFLQRLAGLSAQSAYQIRWNAQLDFVSEQLGIATRPETENRNEPTFVWNTMVLWTGLCSNKSVQRFSRKHSRIFLWRTVFPTTWTREERRRIRVAFSIGAYKVFSCFVLFALFYHCAWVGECRTVYVMDVIDTF
jgi:hypothetical protein